MRVRGGTGARRFDARGRRRAAALAWAVGLALGGASCSTVEFYEKAAFSDPSMKFSESVAELHWLQKIQYSDEGAAGGIGTSAGGGCGCY